ncbi:hypothetical protein NUW58_g5162 [Xylaria curta]|uniref:Uncharacterized protein n=1 Tax=Xylaria curta TaxID=42375 RepID=A0ACC1P2X7_9PEZI|nr:hypothetical protein NUW58_g5162 [Xylaria curta]
MKGSIQWRRTRCSNQKRDHCDRVIPSSTGPELCLSTTVETTHHSPRPEATASDRQSSTSLSSASTSTYVPALGTPFNGALTLSAVSDAGAVNTSTDTAHNPGSRLNPRLFDTSPGSYAANSGFAYLAGETSQSRTHSISDGVGDAHLYDEALYDSSFNVGLPTTWPCSSAEMPSFSDRGIASRPASNAYSSLIPTYDTSAPLLVPHFGEAQGRPTAGAGISNNCDRRCLLIVTPLLEIVENHMHSIKLPSPEGILEWQKSACLKCIQVLGCPACFTNSEHMMLLIMFCDKLITLVNKILSLTADNSRFQTSFQARDREINDSAEIIGVVQLLSGLGIRKIAKLLVCIKASPAVEGKEVQMMLIRNIEQRVERTVTKIKDSIVSLIDQGFSGQDSG